MPTSKKVASKAGTDLQAKSTPKKDWAPIAAALAQTAKKKKSK